MDFLAIMTNIVVRSVSRGAAPVDRYVALDTIRPGDVILSAARTLKSYSIRVGTGSLTASHAAIAIHPLIWFEAVGQGIRYQIISPELVWANGRVRLGLKVPKGEIFSFQRPKINLCGADQFGNPHGVARSLIAISSRFAFLNYARPEAFLQMLKFGLGESALARFAANNMSKGSNKFYPGPFCSWLVAECYLGLGLDLFKISPDRITPAAIARSAEFLEVESKLFGLPIQTPPVFKNFERDLKVALHLAQANLMAVSYGSDLAKVITSLNDNIRQTVKAGYQLKRKIMPLESTHVFQDIEDAEKASFAQWQSKVVESLELAYCGVAPLSEQISIIDDCFTRCRQPWPNGQSCGQNDTDGCHRISDGILRSWNELHLVFPAPSIPTTWS